MKFLVLILSLCLALPVFAGGRANQLTLMAAYPVTVVTSDQLGSAIDLIQYEGPIAIILDVGNTGSSGKTVDVNIKNATTSGGSYTDVSGGAFTQVSDAASTQMIFLNKSQLSRFIKVNIDITTGTSISTAVSATIVGFKKYIN